MKNTKRKLVILSDYEDSTASPNPTLVKKFRIITIKVPKKTAKLSVVSAKSSTVPIDTSDQVPIIQVFNPSTDSPKPTNPQLVHQYKISLSCLISELSYLHPPLATLL